ncbi:MAG: threonine-phosphate decarboxylase [Deltaproteobacteria bacterium]|nr:threonine-phosphate decarboxylase [Deltaproteobacteria bacterium]MBW2302493.1 threonine-phosphate decarboxylase [Deltaproteobacteria bacterium]
MMETIKPHKHGGLEGLCLENPVLDFSVNLNPLGPPEIIRRCWKELIHGIEGYPSLEGRGVNDYFEKKFQLDPEGVLAGNGSTEIIYLTARVLGVKRTLVVVPSYYDYQRASLLAGTRVHLFPLRADEHFSPDPEALSAALQEADALWLGHPNNPTGSLFPENLLHELAGAYPEKWIIVDEAFMPFAENGKVRSLIRGHLEKNILVIQSLTKFYALAGLRLGAIVAHPEVISRLRAAKEPWTVNGLAERIAPLLLRCPKYEERTRVLVGRERRRLLRHLSSLPGLEVYPSAANYLLCRWKSTPGFEDLLKHLLERGIYVRDCRNFTGLEDRYFRIAVRQPGDNDRLISALSSFPGMENG